MISRIPLSNRTVLCFETSGLCLVLNCASYSKLRAKSFQQYQNFAKWRDSQSPKVHRFRVEWRLFPLLPVSTVQYTLNLQLHNSLQTKFRQFHAFSGDTFSSTIGGPRLLARIRLYATSRLSKFRIYPFNTSLGLLTRIQRRSRSEPTLLAGVGISTILSTLVGICCPHVFTTSPCVTCLVTGAAICCRHLHLAGVVHTPGGGQGLVRRHGLHHGRDGQPRGRDQARTRAARTHQTKVRISRLLVFVHGRRRERLTGSWAHSDSSLSRMIDVAAVAIFTCFNFYCS